MYDGYGNVTQQFSTISVPALPLRLLTRPAELINQELDALLLATRYRIVLATEISGAVQIQVEHY